MPKAYSNDLRERVVRAVEAGLSCRSAALRFGMFFSFLVAFFPPAQLPSLPPSYLLAPPFYT